MSKKADFTKEDPPVYVYPDGWGEIVEAEDGRSYIRFQDRPGCWVDNRRISFTEYDLENGKFSQERLKMSLEEMDEYLNRSIKAGDRKRIEYWCRKIVEYENHK